MTMSTSARTYFDDDIGRARELLQLSQTLKQQGSSQRLCRDVRFSAVAMAVGAMDAYFCDKYVDCLTCALRAYAKNQWPGKFPSAYGKALLPAGEVLSSSRTDRPHWGIRMAARQVMAKENMYSVSRVPDAFNPILPSGQKLWMDIVETFIRLNRKRFTGIYWADYSRLSGDAQTEAERKAAAHVVQRLSSTVQYRHEWIHNCGRPKAVIQDLTHGQARVQINEIKSLITIVHGHIESNRLA